MIRTTVCVIGGGVVGTAIALGLARRGVPVSLLEAEPALALGASGTNSGVLHSGFDSTPGELETRLILRSAELRPALLDALGIPVLRCGARMTARTPAECEQLDGLQAGAAANGVPVARDAPDVLRIPGEWVTDPVAYVQALADAAAALGAHIRPGVEASAVARDEHRPGALVVRGPRDERLAECSFAVNAAGLRAEELATASGDSGAVEVYPRKGEFLVFARPPGLPVEIDLPVPDPTTKGVLVFPTVDGMVVAGPTAHDQDDKDDWSVRPAGIAQIQAKIEGRVPGLAGAQPVFAYAGLRPAGRHGTNYVFSPSRSCPGLLHVGAIRSTGLSASLGIAEHVVGLLEGLGLQAGDEVPLPPAGPATPAGRPWWRRAADHRGEAPA